MEAVIHRRNRCGSRVVYVSQNRSGNAERASALAMCVRLLLYQFKTESGALLPPRFFGVLGELVKCYAPGPNLGVTPGSFPAIAAAASPPSAIVNALLPSTACTTSGLFWYCAAVFASAPGLC